MNTLAIRKTTEKKCMKENLLEQLRFCSNLPSLPSVVLKIIDLAGKADTSLTQINHYISHDPALTAKIIKTANSPLYKSRYPVSNISQATNILGTYGVITIALSFSLADSLVKQSRAKLGAIHSNNFWRRSITAALASRALGKRLGMHKQLDDLFLAGLLQDIGILAFHALLPEEYFPVFSSTDNHHALLAAEYEIFGIGHDVLGAALLDHWKFPSYAPDACRHSHATPEKPNAEIRECVAASGYVTDYFLSQDKEKKIDEVTRVAEAYLGLDAHALIEVLEVMQTELQHVEDLFEISILSSVHLSNIITEARELLTTHAIMKVRELEDKVQHDGLTGARNRAYFDGAFRNEFQLSSQQGLPISLAMIDIDNYKTFNDTYGHIAGDGVLVTVARTITDQIRQTDMLCRYGGDEFALILPGTSLAASRNILARVRESIEQITHKPDEANTVRITASIGLAVNMDKEKSFDSFSEMLEAADRALYAAKHAGRNRVVEWTPVLASPLKT